MAIYRGLGYRGVYLGGVYSFASVQRILELEQSFGRDDWREFAREISYSRPGEYFYFAPDPATGLIRPVVPAASGAGAAVARGGLVYGLSKWMHHLLFTPDQPLSRWGARLCAGAADPWQGPKPMRMLEHASKALLFRCKDCGDCSLPEIAYLCPESQCAKNQRNGPCGGTRDGRCEVDGYGDCIWLRAYERLKRDGRTDELVAHAPVVQNQALRGTSSWANHWLQRDHFAQPPPSAARPDGDDEPAPLPPAKQPETIP